MKFIILLCIFNNFFAKVNAVITTTSCPLVCPSGWKTLLTSGNNHCYLFPPVPLPMQGVWDWRSYCQAQQPTSYVVQANTELEFVALLVAILKYVVPYITGPAYIYEGAYYQNGAFHYINGEEPFYSGTHLLINPFKPPTNGTCVYWNPKDLTTAMSWSYRPCSDNQGTSACEMVPIADCAAVITTSGPYVSPTCETRKMTDFAMAQQSGYMGVQDLMTLTGMDAVSCGVACMYNPDCFSFDISDSGECRILGDNNLITCGTLEPANDYRHYDMITVAS